MRGWRIAKISGIGIYIDPSWLLIFVFLVWSLSGFFAPQLGIPRLRAGFNLESLALAVVASLLLFTSVVLHELGHSYVALHYKIPVISITLFIFGGVAQIGDEPERPRVEFLIAIAGPIVSALLAILFGVLWVWSLALNSVIAPQWSDWILPLGLLGQYLTTSNAIIALFNLLPGFPLDGGRILRAILWSFTRNLQSATRIAMYVGRGIAGLLIIVGLLSFAVPLIGLNGLMLALVGGFVWGAAGDAYFQVRWREALKRVTVGEIMTRDVPRVSETLTLDEFVNQLVMPHRLESFLVESDGQIVGQLDTARLRHVPRSHWNQVAVREIMLPLDGLARAQPQETAFAAFRSLNRTDAQDLAVVDENGRLVGLVGHADFERYLRFKAPR